MQYSGLCAQDLQEIKDQLIVETADMLQVFCTFFLVGYVEERLCWPIQSPNVGRKQEAKRKERSDQVY